MPPSQGSDDDGADARGEGATLAEEWGEWGEWGEPADTRLIVRPYSWTRGRTRPVQDLALETLVSASSEDLDSSRVASSEHQAVVGLCVQARSVAEVAALLVLPLGIARVLLADMIDMGLVQVHGSAPEPGSEPDLALMERVLAGLHRL
ncbi:MAG: DUF742 domain-containing protein [Pseudonocardiaceae bacterium]